MGLSLCVCVRARALRRERKQAEGRGSAGSSVYFLSCEATLPLVSDAQNIQPAEQG